MQLLLDVIQTVAISVVLVLLTAWVIFGTIGLFTVKSGRTDVLIVIGVCVALYAYCVVFPSL